MAGIGLDLDQTLVHTHSSRVEGFDSFPISLGEESFFVHVRPHALDLLRFLAKSRLKLVIWTAGTSGYARVVVGGLWRLMGMASTDGATIKSRDDATQIAPNVYIKEVAKMKRELGMSVFILVDDDWRHVLCCPTNKGLVEHAPAFFVTGKEARHDLYLLRLRLKIHAVLTPSLFLEDTARSSE